MTLLHRLGRFFGVRHCTGEIGYYGWNRGWLLLARWRRGLRSHALFLHVPWYSRWRSLQRRYAPQRKRTPLFYDDAYKWETR